MLFSASGCPWSTGMICGLPCTTLTFAGTSTIVSPWASLTTTVTSFPSFCSSVSGVVVSTFSLYSKVALSGKPYLSLSTRLSAGVGWVLSGFATTYWVLGPTTVTFAGISAIGSPLSFATTTTSLSPGVFVSTGLLSLSLYSNVVPSGKSSGSIFSLAKIVSGFVFTGTYCL